MPAICAATAAAASATRLEAVRYALRASGGCMKTDSPRAFGGSQQLRRSSTVRLAGEISRRRGKLRRVRRERSLSEAGTAIPALRGRKSASWHRPCPCYVLTMRRAVVLTIVLAFTGAPLGPAACLVWCDQEAHGQVTEREWCHSRQQSPARVVITGETCIDSLRTTAFVKEDRRWDRPRSATSTFISTPVISAAHFSAMSASPVSTHAELPLIHPPPPLVLRL